MNEAIASIEKNNIWELCKLPSGKHAMGLKWIYKSKVNAQGEIVRLKARLVFSPVARFETVRLVLVLAAHAGCPVFHFDVKSTFLNGDIQEEVFVVQPEGYAVEGR